MTTDANPLEERIAELEAELEIWRAAAVAENDYENARAPAGSITELALFQRLQTAFQQRAPLRLAAIEAARTTAKRTA